MSIPNPNPNIRDLEQVDNYTWSSNKIKSAIDSATAGTADRLDALENKDISVSLISGITGISLPVIVRRGNIGIIRFQMSLPAGTYTDIWQSSVNPATLQNTACILGSNHVAIKIGTDGKIGFVSSQTLNSSASFVGQLVFAI